MLLTASDDASVTHLLFTASWWYARNCELLPPCAEFGGWCLKCDRTLANRSNGCETNGRSQRRSSCADIPLIQVGWRHAGVQCPMTPLNGLFAGLLSTARAPRRRRLSRRLTINPGHVRQGTAWAFVLGMRFAVRHYQSRSGRRSDLRAGLLLSTAVIDAGCCAASIGASDSRCC